MWAASSVSDTRYEYKIHSSVWITEPCKVKRHNKNKRVLLFRVGKVPPKMRSTKSTYFTNNWERYNFRKLNDLSLSLEWRIRSRLFLYLFRSWVNHKAGNHNFLSIKVTHSSDPESYTLLNRMLLSSGPRVHFLPAACASRSVMLTEAHISPVCKSYCTENYCYCTNNNVCSAVSFTLIHFYFLCIITLMKCHT